ncbi:hypothetical protein [Rhizobium sophoriradicis]|uniref:Uncharacterized protein n=1 Tax=Rhizobium sophoriradicis TaxID=1535245 RepID=A0A2A5KNA3_9HYPH|nr:hypothetical protein [Rhizobium sophoriradicis]PCK78492.1 hypothetical protein CPT34_24780 [Rhizobium sophoriradicis]
MHPIDGWKKGETRMQKNEQDLCEVMIRHFEQRTNAARADVTRPEIDRSGPPVEVRFRLGATRYAIEHTLLEPFPRSIQMGAEFEAFARELVTTLNGTLPGPGIYDLIFPIHPTAGQHRRTHSTLRAEIIDWVHRAAAELHAECPERPDRDRRPQGYLGYRTGTINGIKLTLKRRTHWAEKGTRHDGTLFLTRLIEADIEPQRRDRIQTALDDKLGKLLECRNEGDATILVLEFTDIALTSHVSIAEALEPLLGGRSDTPDHIFIADTTGDVTWNLFHVLDGHVFSIDTDWIEIEVNSLPSRVVTVNAATSAVMSSTGLAEPTSCLTKPPPI